MKSDDVLVFDVETTIHSEGAWYDPRNELVCIAYDDICVKPTKDELERFQERVNKASVLVGFNIKFDLHWIRRLGIRFDHVRIYDVQYAEYLTSGQQVRYPSLNDCAEKHLGEHKIDTIKLNYWDRGIQTTEIPFNELKEYAIQDVALTRKLYEVIKIPKSQERLFSLCMQDLLVLLEMEQHGMKFNREGSLALAEEYEAKIARIKEENALEHGVPDFNWGSPNQISALLFGGSINRTVKVPCGVFKSGPNKGNPKFRNEVVTYNLPRRYKPIGYTETGNPTTDDDTLVKLGTDGVAGVIQELRRLQKEVSTYLRGIPAQQDEGHYGHDMIYGQFNQVVTATGRLSSSKPNLQNLSKPALKFFITRYL